jgi:thioredoxin-related protein
MNDIHWSDIQSETMTAEEYLERYNHKQVIVKNYEEYNPKIEIINEIKKILKEKNESFKILVLGADWCPDCSVNTPRMVQLRDTITKGLIELKILYGVKVNALRKQGEILWHSSQSPPEALDPKFDLKKIPTIYFFNKKGKYLGRIIENPGANSTLEEDMLKILKKNL